MFEFAHPEWFWLLLVLLPFGLIEYLMMRKKLRISYPGLDLLKLAAKRDTFWKYLSVIIRALIIVMIVIALTGPREAFKQQDVSSKGIDIVFALDTSGSMRALDMKPNDRLEAAISVAKQFVSKRNNDRIGIVEFSDNAFTRCPMTLDYNLVNQILESFEVDEDAGGTAIGNGLASAVARLKDSEAKSKVIILITDGASNVGEIDPTTAAQFAKKFDIKVYPIGVGKEGPVDYPYRDRFGRTTVRKVNVEIDMQTLHKIAQVTGTKIARRAVSKDSFQKILDEIDALEKTEVKLNDYYTYNEMFYIFALAALMLSLILVILRIAIVVEIP